MKFWLLDPIGSFKCMFLGYHRFFVSEHNLDTNKIERVGPLYGYVLKPKASWINIPIHGQYQIGPNIPKSLHITMMLKRHETVVE